MKTLIEQVKKEYEVILDREYMYVYDSPFELYKAHYLTVLSAQELINIIEDLANGMDLEDMLTDELEVFEVNGTWIYCKKYEDA